MPWIDEHNLIIISFNHMDRCQDSTRLKSFAFLRMGALCISKFLVFVLTLSIMTMEARPEALIMIKGMRMGMLIELAQEHATTRIETFQVSEVISTKDGSYYFTIGSGLGHVQSDVHERVDRICFSGALCKQLFNAEGYTKDEFGELLLESWGVTERDWTNGIGLERMAGFNSPSFSHQGMSYIQLKANNDVNITVYDDLTLSVTKINKRKRRITH